MPMTRTHAVDDLVRQLAARRAPSISRRTAYRRFIHAIADHRPVQPGRVLRAPEGDLMIKIMLLLHRRPDLSVEEFRRYWHTEHQALLVRLPGLRHWC